jgi:3-isopropylmalate/(R)-2-methylmalate dehydratase small subunit
MEGLDDIGLTLRNIAEVEKFEGTRPTYKPKTLPILS